MSRLYNCISVRSYQDFIMKRFALFALLAALCFSLFAQPAGFSNVSHVSGWDLAIGMTFDDNGRMYVWEKSGKVYIVDGGIKSATPLIDLSEEVGNWRDYGLLGFALDPSFLTNGYIYLMYVVDRHHLLYHGTGSYVSTADEYYNATIGRITRYTAESGTGFTTVDMSSRLVLLGETIDTGIPILHQSHGVGTLLFGEDETLLVSTGDGASYFGTDVGGPLHGTFSAQALIDGIISSNEDIGSFRSQSLISLNGKVLRLDKATGDGLPSNPFYDAANPRSPKSRTWALGLRNPACMAIKPGTGSGAASDGNPGTLLVGDVGWTDWEELNVVKFGGMNFGWPIWEGMEKNANYDAEDVEDPTAATPGGCSQTHYQFEQLVQTWTGSTPSYPDPCGPGEIDPSSYTLTIHYLPAFTWQHDGSDVRAAELDGTWHSIDDPGSPITGSIFPGNASIGGVWYNGTDYPSQYQNAYFHADYGQKWIKVFKFDNDMEPQSVEDFSSSGNGRIVALGYHPTQDQIYYIKYGNDVRKFTYSPSGNQAPEADLAADQYYTATNSMTVNFDASGSSDPNGDALTYTWDFGDGNSGSGETPSHAYSVPGNNATTYTVSLTATDPGGLSSQVSMKIFLNNTPPVINSTSLDGITEYSVIEDATVSLSASVTDDTPGSLTYAWQTILHHDNHTHDEPIDYNNVTTTLVSAIGCDGPTYFYRIHLTVTDPEGLSTHIYKELQPRCSPLVEDDKDIYVLGETLVIPVLDNDFSIDPIDKSSLVFKTLPTNGTLSYNATTGEITYIQDGTDVLQDEFTYQVSDTDGDTSRRARVELNWLGRPTVQILSPAASSSVDEKAVKVKYAVSGDTTLIGGIQYQVDSEPPTQENTYSGVHKFFDLGIGSKTLSIKLLDLSNNPLSYSESTDDVMVNARVIGANVKLLTGIAKNIGSSWTVVNLDSTYSSMVVIATPVLNATTDLPAVTRIRNASGSSFELMVQNPSGATLSGYTVHYLVVEEGVYTEAADGITMEAHLVNSSLTASSSGWNSQKENRGYSNYYVSPVVMAQVMSYNDPDWSVAWTSSNDVDVAPYDQKLFIGKHVGSDTDITRLDETIGYVIFTAGSYVIRARPIKIGLGFEGIQGVDDSPSGYTYPLLDLDDPLYAVATSAGMNDSDGGWPVFISNDPISPTELTLAIDEDQIGDSERSHSSEQVAYFVFDSLLLPETPSFPVEWLNFEATPVESQIRLDWATASELNNDYFSIERSKDGLLFETMFDIEAAGNSQEVQSYQAFDEKPLPGRSFYRLRQTDLDGSYSYSHVVEVYFDGIPFLVYPNPVSGTDELSLELHLDRAQTIGLQMINLTGQKVYEQRINLQTSDETLSLPLNDVSPGTYFVYVVTTRKRYVKKVLVNP